MALSWMSRMLKNMFRPVSRSGRKQPNHGRCLPTLEPLDDRILLAITASFSPYAGILSVFGDARDNTIVVSRGLIDVLPDEHGPRTGKLVDRGLAVIKKTLEAARTRS